MRTSKTNQSEWWRGATIYQIYPRSFLDTNGDGIGDLKGITAKLDYVASLGVDAIWLSPFFTSPMKDFGYDVADYCDVDPIFGVLADFDALITRAHELGVKVIIDQVYSHTSDQHAWFAESRKDKTNPKADWYVWADPKKDGSPPNNWQAYFGGPSWQWDGFRKQYYLHNFLISQPDLNLHNEEVQNALLDAARFWLDRGVDGFRLDVVNCFMHDPALADNPPSNLPMEKVSRSFDMQLHTKSEGYPDTVTFIERLRGVLNEYVGDRFTVAEVAGTETLKNQKLFTQGPDRLSTAYSFDFLYRQRLTGTGVKNALSKWSGEADEGWPSWAFTNHDAPRALSRWSNGANSPAHARLYLMLLLSLRGNVFMYQGEELGLPQANVPFEFLQDPEAIENWPNTLGRDGARTPFPWTGDDIQAGFSTGIPWLPIDPRHLDLAENRQKTDDSTLHFARRAIQARQSSPALRRGDISFEIATEDQLLFRRSLETETIWCAFNLSDAETAIEPTIPAHAKCILSTRSTSGEAVDAVSGPLAGYWWRA